MSEDADDRTEPYNEMEAFDTMWQALAWSQLRKRVPVCLKKTLYNRYLLANIIYIAYTIGLLLIDFNPVFTSLPTVEESGEEGEETNVTYSVLDEPVLMNEPANRFYIGNAIDFSGTLTFFSRSSL